MLIPLTSAEGNLHFINSDHIVFMSETSDARTLDFIHTNIALTDGFRGNYKQRMSEIVELIK